MALFAISPARALDASTDFTDLWWNASESGWGMQLVQTGDVVFATLYVYDATGAPTFFVATLARNGIVAQGDLYRTTGSPYLAAPFDPALLRGVRVGTLAFTPTNDTSALLEYTVNGALVQKRVTREPLRFDDYSGRFAAAVSRLSSNCPTSGFDRTGTGLATLTFTQAGTAMTLQWVDADGVSCTYRGVYDQQGKLGSFQASYVCSNAEEGSAAIAPLRIVDGFITGRLRAHGTSNGCDHAGSFATVRPQ